MLVVLNHGPEEWLRKLDLLESVLVLEQCRAVSSEEWQRMGCLLLVCHNV